MANVCVTGAAGRAGRAVVAELMEHGHKVMATDLVWPAGDLGLPVLRADLTDYGQAVEALQGSDAVVHLANIPAPDLRTPAVTFNSNLAMNFNVFTAAAHLRLGRVVWASSETIAGHISQWSGIPFVALRFSNILGPADYPGFPSFWPDPELRKWNLWGYIDERDAAAACRLALDAPVAGSSSFIIAAADTVMTRPSAELMREVFPGVLLTSEVSGTATLLSIDRARRALGFAPAHSWHDHLSP